MSFANRTFNEITTQMLAYFSSQGVDVTALEIGSAFRTLLESVAIVAQQTEEDMAIRLDADIATSAYRSFDFSLQSAQSATGTIRIFPTNNAHDIIPIPQGTAFTIPGTTLRFLSLNTIVFPANVPYLDVPVQAETPGKISNVPANTVISLDSPIVGVLSVTNLHPFINGTDNETEFERRQRFKKQIAKLSRSTANAMQIGIGETILYDSFGSPQERVGKTAINENNNVLTVYIANDVIPLAIPLDLKAASDELVQEVQVTVDGQVIDGVSIPGFRAAGVQVNVQAALMKPFSANVFVRPVTGFSLSLLIAAVEESVSSYVSQLDIGESLSTEHLRRAIAKTRGLDDFSLSLPSIDIFAAKNQVITLIPFTDVTSQSPLTPTEGVSWVQAL